MIARPPSLLMVTTVADTMHFLEPFARHFRALGWRVEGAADGLSSSPRAAAFDAAYDVPFSRSIKDGRKHLAAATAISDVLDGGYDIVHVHTPIASFITRVMARRLSSASRPAVVYTAHGFHFYRGGHPLTNALFVTAERVAGRFTDRLVVMNKEDFEAAQRYRVLPRRRLRYMPGIGVDTDWYSRAQVTTEDAHVAMENIGLDPAKPYFVAVGELSRRKRPTDAVRALSQMQERDVDLLLLGDGSERRAVEALANELGVASRVVISPSWVKDVRPYLREAVGLVQSSRQEGLPRSIMESLALEVPVITSAARGCGELVGEDRGEVVPVGATSLMAAAMDRFMRQPEERARMGARGRRLMVERYDLKSIIERHEQLYAELLPPAPARVSTDAAGS